MLVLHDTAIESEKLERLIFSLIELPFSVQSSS